MNSLVQFPFVKENAVIKRAAKQVADGRERQRFLVLSPQDSGGGHFSLNGRERVFTGREKFQDAFQFSKLRRVRLDGAKFWFVVISKRRPAVEDTAPNLFAYSPADVHREV